MAPVWIGWLSSILLIATLLAQVSKQRASHSRWGVSRWLYAGQVGAELGFVIYSYLVRDWVFVVTNSLLLTLNLLGLYFYFKDTRP